MTSASGCLAHPGLYVIRRPKRKFSIAEHYAVLSVCVNFEPMVCELGLKGLQRFRLENLDEPLAEWDWIGSCAPNELSAARGRLGSAWRHRPRYNLKKSNCEHFAWWVVAGLAQSDQVASYAAEAKHDVVTALVFAIAEVVADNLYRLNFRAQFGMDPPATGFAWARV
jgi:hypothetical protein